MKCTPLAIWILLGLLFASGQAFASSESVVDLALASEGVDNDGRWFQTFRVTIKPGGTLAAVSEAIYGDQSRAADLLRAVQASNPQVKDPGRIPAGLQFSITVDPAMVFIVKESRLESGRETTLYFNGVRETRRTGTGTLRTIEAPACKPIKAFSVAVDGTAVLVEPGSKVLDYQYNTGDTFKQVVEFVYGTASVKAMQDLLQRTGWDPNRWPPGQGRVQAVVPTGGSWEDAVIASAPLPTLDPALGERMQQLERERAKVGVHTLKREPFGTTFRVRVSDPTMTAKKVSSLLYGSDTKYPTVAAQAGLKLQDGMPPGFDPNLLGRDFEIYLDYTEEYFPLGQDVRGDRRVIKLVNGTTIEDYGGSVVNAEGLQRTVLYPTGYKQIVYKPKVATLTLAEFWSFLTGFGRVDNAAVAAAIWNWDPGLSRSVRDSAEQLEIVGTGDKRVLKVLAAPGGSAGPVETFLGRWLGSPCLLVLVVAGLAVLITLTLGRARQPKAAPSRSRRGRRS